MSSPHTAECATEIFSQQVLPHFEICAPRLITAHRKALISEPYSTQSQSRLLAQIEDLVTADRRKDESLALLLHELRSPLASIQNAMAVLRIRSRDESLQQRMHELIERQVRQMVLLTASLGQTAGHRMANLQVDLQRIDLCTVLSTAAGTVTSELTERQHELVVSLPESCVWVLGDASRLEQVFVNLLSNASKYSDIGGKILMSMRVNEGYAVVQVRDSGIGIAADSMPFIFDLFVRADTMAVRTQSGLGIGLALVRSILESHHGTVSAASDGVGHGSEFTVRLKIEN
ncbi:MAG: HAMP domain-containing sensor histidine kinase [Steroidobacteraceae bacterium]